MSPLVTPSVHAVPPAQMGGVRPPSPCTDRAAAQTPLSSTPTDRRSFKYGEPCIKPIGSVCHDDRASVVIALLLWAALPTTSIKEKKEEKQEEKERLLLKLSLLGVASDSDTVTSVFLS